MDSLNKVHLLQCHMVHYRFSAMAETKDDSWITTHSQSIFSDFYLCIPSQLYHGPVMELFHWKHYNYHIGTILRFDELSLLQTNLHLDIQECF